jgi:3-hydroxyisobutyrate dehydrogenase-like beta-hydroxyacid dehydrogenase
MAESIGFIGLGRMGQGIAARLLEAGYPLVVYNRTASKGQPLVAKGVTAAREPADAASPGGIVFSIVADDRAVEEICSDALLARLGPGGVHVSMGTIAPVTAMRLAERHAQFGAVYVASPVFGRPDAAAAGKLWICTSGQAAAKQRVRPLLEGIGQGIFDFGEAVGAANVVKLAGNFLIMAATEAMAEAAALGEKSGIPRAALLEMLNSTLFNCAIYQGYGRKIIDGSFEEVGFAMPLLLKDIKLALETGDQARAPMPMASLVRDRLLSALAKGREKLDGSAFSLESAEGAGLEWMKP